MNLSIDTITIRQDEHGRFSLNDLYRASGSANKKRPSLWLRSSRTQELVSELEREISEQEFLLRNEPGLGRNSTPESRGALSRKSGSATTAVLGPNSGPEIPKLLSTNSCSETDIARFLVKPVAPVFTESMGNPGTWVVEDLVYEYAMWISPKFHIKVIRVFRAAMANGYVKPNIQAENFWFALRPHWKPIRDMAASGMLYRDIAAAVGRSVRSVAHCVQRMIEVGLMNPTQRVLARFKLDTAQRMINQNQLCLSWGVRV